MTIPNPPWPTGHVCQMGETCPECEPGSGMVADVSRRLALRLEEELRRLGEARVREMAAEGWARYYWSDERDGAIAFHVALVPPGTTAEDIERLKKNPGIGPAIVGGEEGRTVAEAVREASDDITAGGNAAARPTPRR